MLAQKTRCEISSGTAHAGLSELPLYEVRSVMLFEHVTDHLTGGLYNFASTLLLQYIAGHLSSYKC